MPFRIRRKHEELQSLMGSIFAAIKDGPNGNLALLLQARVRFSKVFRKYLMEEQELLQALPDTPLKHRATLDLQQMQSDYSAHITIWTPERIAGDWPGYVSAVTTFDHRLLRHLSWEDHEVLPHLGKSIAA